MIIDIKFLYTNQSEKFLKKNKDAISRNTVNKLIIKGLQKIFGKDVNVDIKKLRAYDGLMYRIRKGNIRIIFSYEHKEIYIVTIENINFRDSAYK